MHRSFATFYTLKSVISTTFVAFSNFSNHFYSHSVSFTHEPQGLAAVTKLVRDIMCYFLYIVYIVFVFLGIVNLLKECVFQRELNNKVYG